MTIAAIIVADSINHEGDRITTLQLRYPRFIHAEFMTHRVFSRNASSSRAIPVERLIRDILDDTAMPSHWGKNQPGMQAREEHDALVEIFYYHDAGRKEISAVKAWEHARSMAIETAIGFHKAGYHKQIVNRLLEPYSHINVVVTATDWDNFFLLRDHPDAQPEIRVLAQEIKNAMAASTPVLLEEGGWHLPYVLEEDFYAPLESPILNEDDLVKRAIKVSVARCARVSYLTHDGRKTTVEEDVALHDKLVVAEPLHASPAEHQATPIAGRERNFQGWRQYRTLLELSA